MQCVKNRTLNPRWRLAAGLLIISAIGVEQASGQSTSVRRRFAQVHMGVQFEITFYSEDENAANRAAQAAFERIALLDAIMSDYDQDSELMRLSATAGKSDSVRVSPDLWTVLTRSTELARASNGAFDITVGPVVRLWRRARRQKKLPGAERLQMAKAAVGYKHIKFDNSTNSVELLRPGMRLDLGGIAKGYAADAALNVLEQRGITRAMVDAGGDIVVGDAPPGAPGWRIGIAVLANSDAEPHRHIMLTGAAVATSGDAYQFVDIDGVRYSHIVDPKTGIGLTDRSSVTVIARDGATADGLASAVSVVGPRQGLRLIAEFRGAEALIVRQIGVSIEVTKSCDWNEFVECVEGTAASHK